jgi:hypothetical protein
MAHADAPGRDLQSDLVAEWLSLCQLPVQRTVNARERLPIGREFQDFALFRLRVAAAFLADADRSPAARDADAAPPFLPPFLLDTLGLKEQATLPVFLYRWSCRVHSHP